MRGSVLIQAAISLLFIFGCAREQREEAADAVPSAQDDNVLARVGDAGISVGDLYRFTAEMPAVLRSEQEGTEAVRDYLQSMIDKELMLREGRSLKLAGDPSFQAAWDQEFHGKLAQEYLTRNFSPSSEDEQVETWRKRFADSKWSRLLRLAHIRVGSPEKAREIVRQLDEGRSFGEAAREHSASQGTAADGGVIDAWIGRGNLGDLGLPLEVAEEVFELPAGEVSRPFRIGDGYEILTVVEERDAPDWYLPVFVRVEIEKRFLSWRDDLVAGLARSHGVRMEPEAVSVLLQGAPTGGKPLELPAEEQGLVLCRFDGREYSLADFARAYGSFSTFRAIEFDDEGIEGFAVNHLLRDSLLARAARDAGIDSDPEVLAWLNSKRDNMMIEALRKREVDDRITASEESIRRYYEENKRRFMRPAEIAVAEILVKTREQAEQLARRVRRGEDIRKLASQYSVREDVVVENGVFHMHPYERVVFGELLAEAEDAEVGELRGPIEVDEGFSLFEVVEKIPPRPDSFERARGRAEFWVKDRQERRYFGELLARLREKYASEVVVHEDRLFKVEI